jgi:hypothetical protein
MQDMPPRVCALLPLSATCSIAPALSHTFRTVNKVYFISNGGSISLFLADSDQNNMNSSFISYFLKICFSIHGYIQVQRLLLVV